ncbi:DUF3102 domain-containing protein [Lutibaculum baratangense]|uniref:DUF3102 domain-containing protein n=1 Tax=Lutibaculum baratangense AMV1 TaxID=631454 RepID=V4R8P4_9HYPH|nr:DUF3102 domain-containing protein [Lutibaculum baratangense]ESR22546.1 hypothetical protein N177_4111 [Lutibaculum baratangense AMV1]
MTDTTTATTPLDLKAMGVPDDQIAEIEERTIAIQTIGRKTVEQALDVGEHLSHMEGILPEATWRPWLKERCDLGDKQAGNLIKVHGRFNDRRKQLMRDRVSPTVLIALINAKDELVEYVLDAYANQQRLTVDEVKALKREASVDGEAEKLEPGDIGGAKGLKAAANLVLSAGVAELMALCKAMARDIEEALAEVGDKRLVKDRLSKQLEIPARIVVKHIEVLLAPLEFRWESGALREASHSKIPTSRWREVRDLLYTLGSHRGWPASSALKVWLKDEVLPALQFVTKGEPFGEPKATLKAQAEAGADAPETVETSEATEGVEPAAAEPEMVADAPSLAVEPEEPVEAETPKAKRAGPVLVEAETEVGSTPKTSRPSPRRKAKLEVVENETSQPSI